MDKKNTRRTFTLEYKQDAVKLVTEQGYSRQKAADSLGISLCSGQVKLATVLYSNQYCCSARFGGNPSLC